MLDLVYKIYQYCSNAFYIVLFLNMMELLFEKKRYAYRFLYYGVIVGLFWTVYYFPQYGLGHPTIPYYYYFATLMPLTLIWILTFLKGSVIHKLIYFLYYFTVYKCIVFFLGGIVYDYETVLDRSIYICVDMAACIVPVSVLLLFRRFMLRHPIRTVTGYLSNFQVALMMYCPVSVFIVFQLLDPSVHFNTTHAISVSAVLLVWNLPILYYLYIKIGENTALKLELEQALAETSAQLSRYRYSVLSEEHAKKERHELKNKYFYIRTLLKENKLEQLDSFLSEHIGELDESRSGINTNNVLIDYILNSKLTEAKKHHIKTYSEILIPEEILINEEYFCTVLLNLFDNAIEASCKEKDPDIQVYLTTRNHYLVFCIKNKVHQNILETNPDFKTSKTNSANHGLGMKIIKRAVRKAGGIFDTSMENNYFVATAMFPILS